MAAYLDMDNVFGALADPTRRQLLDSLNENHGQTLRELCSGLDMARQSVSKHLGVLEAANLVVTVRRGREKLHYLNAAPISESGERWISRFERRRVQALTDLKRELEDGAAADRPAAGAAEGRRRGRSGEMTLQRTGTRDEWLAARLALLQAEKEHTRRGDELARMRRELPWVRIEKPYVFETDEGEAALADLFRGRSQLLVYHFMFGPDYSAGCLACSAIADGFDGFATHLANHDVMLWAVSRAPLEKLQRYKRRMGWGFPWASSYRGDFNNDFAVSLTDEQERAGTFEYNFRESQVWSPPQDVRGRFDDWASTTGTDWATYARERPGMSAFVLEDGAVYHTYSAYSRGLDGLWGMYQWLDRTPRGRNETRGPGDPLNWFRRHDEYEND